jgi:hypothetical protein
MEPMPLQLVKLVMSVKMKGYTKKAINNINTGSKKRSLPIRMVHFAALFIVTSLIRVCP